MSGKPPEFGAGLEPSGDYLWDGTGPVDLEVQRLEALLGPYRTQVRDLALRTTPVPQAARLPVRDAEPDVAHVRPLRGRPWAAAAMVAMAVGALWLAWRPAESWTVRVAEGGARAGDRALGKEDRLRVGEWLETGAGSAQLEVAGLGHVDVEPGSRIRIKETGESRKLLELGRGEIHAMITADARVFLVDTPWARAVDLGCEYTLSVAPDGAGELRVDLGYVALEWGGLVSTVPMNGGVCLTRPGRGPGTPYFDDATARFKAELERLDFADGGRGALEAVLEEARARDALSLWHLLARTRGTDREAVFGRLVVLKPLPEGVTREGVLGLDAGMLEEWWDGMRPF